MNGYGRKGGGKRERGGRADGARFQIKPAEPVAVNPQSGESQQRGEVEYLKNKRHGGLCQNDRDAILSAACLTLSVSKVMDART